MHIFLFFLFEQYCCPHAAKTFRGKNESIRMVISWFMMPIGAGDTWDICTTALWKIYRWNQVINNRLRYYMYTCIVYILKKPSKKYLQYYAMQNLIRLKW